MASFNRYNFGGRGMGRGGFGGGYGGMQFFPPVIKWLLIINAVIFVLTEFGLAELFFYGALWPVTHPNFFVWQYFTYMFLHGGLFHIFFNMLILWMFGMELEQMWGSKRFLVYYLVCGLGAGVLHSLISLAVGPGAPTVGASGAIMGIMVAFGMNFPDRIILVGFFFPLKAKYAILLFAAIDLYSGLASTFGGTESNIAHFAHLAGALVGFIMLKVGGKMTLGGIFDRIPGRTTERVERHPPPPPRATRGEVIDVDFRDMPTRQPPPRMDFGDEQSRIDEILDKISTSGYQTLTEEEKEILLQASRKMK